MSRNAPVRSESVSRRRGKRARPLLGRRSLRCQIALLAATAALSSTALAAAPLDPAVRPSISYVTSTPTESGSSSAGGSTISVNLSQSTGTAPFDSDDTPGNDADAMNDVVRTNDTVTYSVEVRREGEPQTGTTITLTLPRGEELISLPPYCLAPGSTVTPDDIPDPTVPVTATSWEDLPAQTISCVLADQSGSSSLVYDFVTKVRPEVPDGTRLDEVSAHVSSDQVTEPVISSPVSHRVSARAELDLSKIALASGPAAGPLVRSEQACSYDSAQFCYRSTYSITANTRPGGKGNSPVQSPLTFVDDLTPEALFGPDVTASEAWQAAGAEATTKYGARLLSCGGHIKVQTPGSKAPTSEQTGRAVRDSGSIDCAQPAGPGTPVDVTITDADTTAYTVPTENSNGGALPADSGLVISLSITIEIPRLAIADLGTLDGQGTRVLPTFNTFTDITALGLDGQPAVGENPANNTKTDVISFRAGSTATGVQKTFIGIPGHSANTPATSFSAGRFEGPPGSGQANDGNTVVVPGQHLISALTTSQKHTMGMGDETATSALICDAWDDSRLGLASDFPDVAPSGAIRSPSNGASAWLGQWDQGSVINLPATAPLRNFVIEYGYAPNPGPGEGNACDRGVWASSPDLVPGAVAVDGAWTGINRVRYSYTSTSPETSTGFSTSFFIGMKVLDSGAPSGTTVGNWASVREARGVHTMAQVLADPTADQRTSPYDPATNLGGLMGDRVTLGSATTSVRKFVRSPGAGNFTDTTVEYASGAHIEYRLNPALVADVDAGTRQSVILEDCLPAYQVYSSSRRESGAAIEPTTIRNGSPTDSALQCPTGQQYLRWDLGSQEVNSPIDPVIYEVDTLTTARNGVYTNTALVSAPGDVRPVALRQDTASVQLTAPKGVALTKSTPTPVVEVNPTGVLAPRLLTWDLEFANLHSPSPISDIDIIDVLPSDGQARSSFTGDMDLVGVDVVAGEDVEVRYTNQTPDLLVTDANDPSNASEGSTLWCDAAAGGAPVSGIGESADCPTAISEVTGIRLFRPGPFTPDDHLKVTVTAVGIDNAGGDLYENQAAARVLGMPTSIGPATSTIKSVSSEIGDHVWEDTDSDGIQDDGELGLADVSVRLEGTDVDGNLVTRTTVTGPDGDYAFQGLASGTYELTFAPEGLPPDWAFTLQGQGEDSQADSDVDAATGTAGPITLSPDTIDHSWDAGILIDRNVDLSIHKEIIGQSEVDHDGTLDVTYRLTVSNAGTAHGTYDLDDTFRFGTGIVPGTVSVIGPPDITIDPTFDGVRSTRLASDVSIPGGQTHVYEVTTTVQVDMSTTTASAGDCTLTADETGTGLLNVATLTSSGKQITDEACGAITMPRGSIGDRVWLDLDGDGLQGAAEPGVPGVGVTLTGTDVDGNPIDMTTTTDDGGWYSFADLPAGTYAVTFDRSETGATAFTTPSASADSSIDSDADANGRTATFTLAWGEQNSTIDAGLINVSLSITKSLTHQADGTVPGTLDLSYEITVANTGLTATTYELVDVLRFGEGIIATNVTVEGPPGVPLDAQFDGTSSIPLVEGQVIDGGQVHTYVVSLVASVPTTITTSQADCTLTLSEHGTGLLNEARLTVDGTEVVDTACGDVETPQGDRPGGLPTTGAAVALLVLWSAGLLLLGLWLRHRRRAGTDD